MIFRCEIRLPGQQRQWKHTTKCCIRSYGLKCPSQPVLGKFCSSLEMTNETSSNFILMPACDQYTNGANANEYRKKRSALALMVITRTVFTFHTGCSYSYRETNYMQLTILQSELDSIAKLYDDGSVFLAAMGPTSVAKGKRAKILYSNERRIVDGRRS